MPSAEFLIELIRALSFTSPTAKPTEPKTRSAQHSAILLENSCWAITMSLSDWRQREFEKIGSEFRAERGERTFPGYLKKWNRGASRRC
jgi:hypothetical protein